MRQLVPKRGKAQRGEKMSEQNEKTFTQEEVNEFVESRLAKERKKYADYDMLKEKAGKYDEQQNEGESELQKATERADGLQKELDALKNANSINSTRANVSKDTGVPAELLTGEDEETCKAQAEAILKFAEPKKYPGAKKNDHKSGADSTGKNDEAMREFARKIFNKGE